LADLLQRGSDWLEGQRVKHLTRSVIYQRGASRVEVSATIGRTVFEVDDGFGVFERIESRDYLILVQDLVFNGQPAIPEPGDRILEADGSRTIVYEVMAPGREPHWRYSDPYRKTLRIHTKQVEEQT
jgi:hypothetical protein